MWRDMMQREAHIPATNMTVTLFRWGSFPQSSVLTSSPASHEPLHLGQDHLLRGRLFVCRRDAAARLSTGRSQSLEFMLH
jgi:hypothetical protein